MDDYDPSVNLDGGYRVRKLITVQEDVVSEGIYYV